MTQAMPKPGDRAVFPEVRRLFDEREQAGLATYGRSLETSNGRSFLRDATEEALDLVAYLVGLRMELEDVLETLESLDELMAAGYDVSHPIEDARAKLRTIVGRQR